MDWNRGGRTDRFRYVRVTWPDWEEAGEVGGVSSSDYQRAYLSDLQVSGRAVRRGEWWHGDDMLRCYSTSELDGETVELCHYTCMLDAGSTSFTSASGQSEATLFSPLCVLQAEVLDESLTVPKGADAVAWVRSACRGRHLRVGAPDATRPLVGAASFEPGTTMLSVCNGLMNAVGWQALGVDAYGAVVLTPYADPSGRAPSALLDEEGGGVLVSADFSRTVDASAACNVVTLVGTDADGNPLRAQARNDSPSSQWSTTTRRRTVSYYEEETDPTTQAALDSKAAAKLRESTMAVETVEVRHFWAGLEARDVVTVDFPSHGVAGDYSVTAVTCELVPGMPCTTSARRTVQLEGLA